MGIMPPNAGRYEYWNISKGQIKRRNKDGSEDVGGGISGVIKGVRAKEGAYDGDTTMSLQLLIMDPDGTLYVLAGTLWTYQNNRPNKLTVWARMFFERVFNTENNIRPDELLEIGFYMLGKATCCAIRRPKNDKALPSGGRIDEYDMNLAQKFVDLLIARYGEFGKAVDQGVPESALTNDDNQYPPDEHKAADDDLPF